MPDAAPCTLPTSSSATISPATSCCSTGRVEIISAETPEDFDAALERAEAARRGGKWLAGYFSYEAGYLLEPKLRPLLPEGRRAPLCCLGVFDGPSETRLPADRVPATNGPIFDARATWSFDDYRSRFERVHRHLREGDCYQANLTFPVEANWTGDPLSAFDALAARQPVKYGALVELGGPVILSRSPELFFEIDEDGWIETHPMKGTAPRGATPRGRRGAEALPAQRPEEPGREPDDRRPAAQRHLADLRGRHARRAGAVPHRELCRPCTRW